ncbi:MAG: hypothetical protein MUF66_08490 [Gammaproteobacteria bacterium]|nr:hypothetical protein [Gammaproteobacteria bacterium]
MLDARGAFWQRVEEPLQRARKFLYDLNARLTYFPREIRASYRVEGFGDLEGLRQGEYRLDFPPAGRKHPLALHFVCRGEAGVTRQLVTPRLALTHHTDYLQRHGIGFSVSEVFHGAGAEEPGGPAHLAIHLVPVVPVSLTFDVDPEGGGLRLHLWNLEQLGRASYPLAPDRVDDTLLAEVEKAILREPSRLNALTGFRVPEEVRGQLQRRLYVEARRKAIELAGGRAQRRPRGLLASLFARDDPPEG